jgi:hypothetical protein
MQNSMTLDLGKKGDFGSFVQNFSQEIYSSQNTINCNTFIDLIRGLDTDLDGNPTKSLYNS